MNFKHIILCFCLISCLKGSEVKAEATSAGDFFVKLPMFVVPVIQERKLKAIYSITLVLEVKSAVMVDKAQKMIPRIIDKIHTDLYGLFGLVWKPNVYIKLPELKERLLKVCEKTLGPDSIKSVLVQGFNQRIIH